MVNYIIKIFSHLISVSRIPYSCIRLFPCHDFSQDIYPKAIFLMCTSFFAKSKWELISTYFAKMCQIYMNAFFTSLIVLWKRNMDACRKTNDISISKGEWDTNIMCGTSFEINNEILLILFNCKKFDNYLRS